MLHEKRRDGTANCFALGATSLVTGNERYRGKHGALPASVATLQLRVNIRTVRLQIACLARIRREIEEVLLVVLHHVLPIAAAQRLEASALRDAPEQVARHDGAAGQRRRSEEHTSELQS